MGEIGVTPIKELNKRGVISGTNDDNGETCIEVILSVGELASIHYPISKYTITHYEVCDIHFFSDDERIAPAILVDWKNDYL